MRLRKTLSIFVLAAILSGVAHATIFSTSSRMDYTGNGSATVFPYTFKIFDQGDIQVFEVDTSGVQTVLTLNTDYSVSGAGSDAGGSVTLGTALVSGYTLTIKRLVTIDQETDLRNQNAFYPSVHEDAFDHATMVDQQQQDEIDRSFKLPESEVGTSTNTTFPSVAQRASNFLAFDALGNPIASVGAMGNNIPVSAYMGTVLDDASAAAARTTLGAASQVALDAITASGLWETGDIKWSARSTPSSGWLACDGSSISTTTYSALFAQIGYTYGGAGANFSVPNMARRVAVGKGGAGTATLGSTLGSTGGEETHTLTTAEIPAHSHTITDPGHSHTERARLGAAGGPNFAVRLDGSADTVNDTTYNTTLSATTGITINNAGGGGAHNVIQPSIVLSAFIKS